MVCVSTQWMDGCLSRVCLSGMQSNGTGPMMNPTPFGITQGATFDISAVCLKRSQIYK